MDGMPWCIQAHLVKNVNGSCQVKFTNRIAVSAESNLMKKMNFDFEIRN